MLDYLHVSVPLRGFGYLKLEGSNPSYWYFNKIVSVPLRGFGYLKHSVDSITFQTKGGFRPLAGIWLSKTFAFRA